MRSPIIFVLLCACTDAPLVEDSVESASAIQLTPVADAYVRSGSHAAETFGGETTLAIKRSASPTDDFNRETYIEFDIAGVAAIGNAKLRLFGSAGGASEPITTEVRTADSGWSESQLTWATRPASHVLLGSVPLATSDAWHEVDVTPYLQAEQAAGHHLVTFLVRDTVASTTGTPGFHAREAASSPPTLAIDATGAVTPWTHYEAEAGARHPGAALQTGTSWGQVAFEASGKQAVVLDSGEWIEWSHVVAASHLTVRFSLADGATASLAVLVNGSQVATLPLTSARMREDKPGSLPGDTVRFFDDTLLAVPGGIPAGATVRLQLTAGAATTIDQVELETAPPPLARPDATWTQVTGHDGAAIRAAITTGSKKIWLPAGVYTVTDTIALPAGVAIRGAGMWHTVIMRNNTIVNASLFTLGGNNQIRDLKVISNLTKLVGQNVAIRGDGQSGSTVENVWTEYISLFLGFNASKTTIRGNRVRNAYKDSIHLARASVGNLVENNTVRNSGDDGVALVSYETTGMANNLIRNNTIEVSYWGRGLTNLGGDGNQILNNVVVDTTGAGILVGPEQYSTTITPYVTNWTISGNTVVRCGNQVNHEMGGAVAIRASVDRPISGHMENNRITSPPADGAQISGYVGDSATTVYFRNNGIAAPATAGFVRKRMALRPGSHCVDTPNTDL